jgi:hypothetical protein
VQRALKLWATGTISLQMVLDSKAMKGSKGVSLPKVINGTEESTAFNDATWGSVTRIRMEFINNKLRLSSMEKILEKVKAVVVTNPAGGREDAMDINEMSVDMVDLSESDD